jgi:hypothetical protein
VSVTGISDKTMCPEAISGRRISILKIQILIIIRKWSKFVDVSKGVVFMIFILPFGDWQVGMTSPAALTKAVCLIFWLCVCVRNLNSNDDEYATGFKRRLNDRHARRVIYLYWHTLWLCVCVCVNIISRYYSPQFCLSNDYGNQLTFNYNFILFFFNVHLLCYLNKIWMALEIDGR